MNSTINTWIDRFNNGEIVSLSGLTELFNSFPSISFSTKIPTQICGLTNFTITNISASKNEDQAVTLLFVSLKSDQEFTLINGKYAVQTTELNITVSNPDGEAPAGTVSSSGILKHTESAVAFPVFFSDFYLEEGAAAYGPGDAWRISYTNRFDEGTATALSRLKLFLADQTIDEAIPGYFTPADAMTVSDLSIVYESSSDSFISFDYSLNYGTWNAAASGLVHINDAILTCSSPYPYSPNNASVTMSGALCAGTFSLPNIEVIFSRATPHVFKLYMLDREYSLSGLDALNGLLSGGSAASILPSGLSQLANVVLSKFSCEFDTSSPGFNSLFFSLKAADAAASWEIIPSILSIKNISLNAGLYPLAVEIKGTAGIKNTDIALRVSYQAAEDGSMPSTYCLELDRENTNEYVPIAVDDLSILGFEPIKYFTGLLDIKLGMTNLAVHAQLSGTPAITYYEIGLVNNAAWNLLPVLSIKNASILFQHTKGNEYFSDSTTSRVGATLDIAGVDPIPIMLTIPSEGDWNLELVNGVTLPTIQSIVRSFYSGIDALIPPFIGNKDISLTAFNARFPNPSEGKLSSVYFSIAMPDVVSISSYFKMENLCFEMEIDYTASEPKAKGAVSCTAVLGSLVLPFRMPLPVNSEEWTLQLYDTAHLPSLSDITKPFGFDANKILSELTGFSGIPKIDLSTLNLKFSTDPFAMQKMALTADFEGGISLTLPPGVTIQTSSVSVGLSLPSDGDTTLDYLTILGAIICGSGDNATTIPVRLSYKKDRWELSAVMAPGEAIPVHFDLIESIMPGLKLPNCIGKAGVDFKAINLVVSETMGVIEFDVTFDIKGLGAIISLGILKHTIPIKAIYENQNGEERYGVQILDWPFAIGDLKELGKPYEGWILVDLHEFGSIKLELPKFLTDGDNFIINSELKFSHKGEQVLLADGSTMVTQGLNIPVKYLFEKMGLSAFTSAMPTRIPLTPEKDLKGIIKQAGGNPDNLPYAFQDYLDISIPDGLEYDIIFTSSGDVSFNARLPENIDLSERPLKMLFFGGIELFGIKLYNIGFSSIIGNPFLNIDMEFDAFNLPLLAAMTWLDVKNPKFLPDFKKVNVHLNTRDVWILLSTVIPIPIFFKDISLSYCGIEGLALGGGIKFPKPGLNVIDFPKIAAFLGQLAKYISDKDYYLKPQDLGQADLKFTLGPTYAELPVYTGGVMVGKKSDIFTESASDILCLLLNSLKSPSLTKFITMVPEELRFIDKEIAFGPVQAALKVGFTTVEEFKNKTVAGYPSNILSRLFADVQEGLLAIAYGKWEIQHLMDFEVMMGMSVHDFKGAALQVGLHGDIGDNFIGCEITGVTAINADNHANPIVIDMRSKLSLLRQPIGTFETRLDGSGFYMKGGSTLLDWAGFKVKAELEGSLDSKGKFLLAGDAEIQVPEITLLETKAKLTNTTLQLSSQWMGLHLDFHSRVKPDDLILEGSAGISGISINRTIPGVSVPTPYGHYTIKSLHIECGADADITMSVSKQGIDAGVHVSFDFLGRHSFTLSLASLPNDLSRLKEFIIDNVIQWIIDHLLSPGDAWEGLLNLIKDGFAVVEDVAKVLAAAFGKTAEEVANALYDAAGFTKEAVAAAIKSIVSSAEDVAKVMGKVFDMSGNEISDILKKIGFSSTQAAEVLKNLYNYTSDQMVESLFKAGAAVKDVAECLGKIYGKTAEEIAKFLSDLGQDVTQIAAILFAALGYTMEQIGQALKKIGKEIAAIAKAMADIFKCATQVLANALNSIGATAAEIADALNRVIQGISPQEIGKALKSLGKGAEEVAAALGSALGMSAAAIGDILNAISFDPHDIAGALKNVFHLSGDAVGAILNGFGASAADVAAALSNIFHYGPEQITSLLKGFHVSVDDIGSIMLNTLKLPPVRVADLMKGAGAAADAVAGFLGRNGIANVGNVLEQAGFAASAIKDIIKSFPCVDHWVCPDCCITHCCITHCCITHCCVIKHRRWRR